MNPRTTVLLVAMLTSMPAFSGGAQQEEELQAIRTYCKPDVERLCAGVEPGGGRMKDCLMKHKEQMSVGCAQALQKMKKMEK
jgi:hypothetical protein